MIKAYCSLVKPGIIFGNMITMLGGFFLATKGHIEGCLLGTIVGLGFVIASACVFNNYIDRVADQKMARTKNRPLVTRTISTQNAIVFAVVLVLLGTWILASFVNLLTLALAWIGFLIYVLIYGFSKYYWSCATLVGSIAGAIPPLVGYAAAADFLSFPAWILFATVALWQMPHFYAISLYRLQDYTAAAIPVLPVKDGIHKTKIHMIFYVFFFVVATLMLPVLGYTGALYGVVMALLGCSWLALSLKGLIKTQEVGLWARKMFFFSLIIIMVWCILIGINVQ